MNESAALSIFKKLSLEYVNEEMLLKEFESNYLECKEKQKAESSNLDQGDKANLAKALSGFANTAGGVLIFGLQAKKKDEVDEITAICPITDVKKFEARIRELESRVVERLVPNVEYKRIETGNGNGILAIHMPESNRLPHRSLMDHKFYMRAGGTFQPLDLNIIEDLFARRSAPDLELDAKAISDTDIVIYIKSTGKASAKSPFLAFAMPDLFSLTGYELDGNTKLTSCRQVRGYKELEGRVVLYTAGAAEVVHPGSEIPFVKIRGSFRMQSGYAFQMEYFIYAEHMAEKRDVVKFEYR